jgi:hypothetical protein
VVNLFSLEEFFVLLLGVCFLDDSSSSNRESDAEDDKVPDFKASPKVDEFKPIDEEEEAKKALLLDSDSDEPSG